MLDIVTIREKRKRCSVMTQEGGGLSDSTNDTASDAAGEAQIVESSSIRQASQPFQQSVKRLKTLASEFRAKLSKAAELKESEELYW